MSKVAILASALSYFFHNICFKVPKESRHIHHFAFDVVMIMEPATLLGTIYGVIASRMVPFWMISFLAVILLTSSSHLTYLKAKELRSQEKSKKVYESELLLKQSRTNESKEYGTIEEREFFSTSGVSLFKDEVVLRSICTVIFCFCLVVFNSFYIEGVGKDYFNWSIECLSVQYFSSIAFVSLIIIFIIYRNDAFLVNYQNRNKGSKLLPSLTVDWCSNGAFNLALLCFAAGFLSSFCGVGGSTIKNPILLYLNLNPTLAKATSQFMLLTTVGAAMFQYWFQGSIPINFAVVFFIISLISAVVGKTLIDQYVRRIHNQSIIVFLLAFYIFLSTIALGSIGAIIVVGQLMDWKHLDPRQLWFRSPCTKLPVDLAALRLISGK